MNLQIAGTSFCFRLAESEVNRNKKTLFATHLWEGAKILTLKLLTDFSDLIRDKTVVEFGAAAGLPSLGAISAGARLVIATDYPAEQVLSTLQLNITSHSSSSSSLSTLSITHVVEHIWGQSCQMLLALNNNEALDVALASECLWRHELHADLVYSLKGCLRIGGLAFVSFTHHFPGREEKDLEFFSIADTAGLETVEKITQKGKHMWSDRVVDVKIYILRRRD